jgi:transcriptional regulator with XRE-family HTH domain
MSIRKSREQIKRHAAISIKRHREANTTSQQLLASKVGVSQPLISAWERGKVAPSVEDLVAIELALGLDRGQLILEVAYGGSGN